MTRKKDPNIVKWGDLEGIHPGALSGNNPTPIVSKIVDYQKFVTRATGDECANPKARASSIEITERLENRDRVVSAFVGILVPEECKKPPKGVRLPKLPTLLPVELL
ncbi:MAG: hypothetical protein D6728_05315 [Cyanobacteria bacterium J055]|nr:MAG: hypothetical protein D6728_05315 [Cyanobacteria bacterium J055]